MDTNIGEDRLERIPAAAASVFARCGFDRLILATMDGVVLDSRFGQGDALARLEKITHGLLLAISTW